MAPPACDTFSCLSLAQASVAPAIQQRVLALYHALFGTRELLDPQASRRSSVQVIIILTHSFLSRPTKTPLSRLPKNQQNVNSECNEPSPLSIPHAPPAVLLLSLGASTLPREDSNSYATIKQTKGLLGECALGEKCLCRFFLTLGMTYRWFPLTQKEAVRSHELQESILTMSVQSFHYQ